MSGGLTVHNGSGGTAINVGTYDAGGYSYIQSAYVNNASVARDLAFFTGASERMRIDSAGRVTMPNQPAFSAFGNNQSYSSNTDTVCNLANEEFDFGNNFNPSTGKFTAPVGGRYLFTGTIQYQHNGTAHIQFRVNGAGINNGWSDFGDAKQATQSRILNLASGDTVNMWLYHVTAGTTTGARTRMTGHLIG
jgi:hypothetical protein